LVVTQVGGVFGKIDCKTAMII